MSFSPISKAQLIQSPHQLTQHFSNRLADQIVNGHLKMRILCGAYRFGKPHPKI